VSDRVRIQVEATDNASDDFQRIGTNAARMGQQVTQAGRSASQGLKPIDQSAKQAQTALVALEREAAKMPTTMSRVGTAAKNNATTFAAMGAAATTLAGFLSDAARAAAEEEAIFARLETAVEATGASYADYAVQIEQAIDASERLSFADDEAAAALANLTSTTGDAAEALDLLGLAQDLARGKGIELAAAANIVGRVAEGNTGILARYGIAIQEGATAQEALAAVQERYAGQAQAYADTTAGAYDRISNTIANFVESIGAGTGDLQLFLTLLPGISAGYTLIGGAAGLAVKGIQSLRAASALATVAMGPVGLAAAAVAAGVAIGSMTDWFGLARSEADQYADAVKRTQEATKALNDTLYEMRNANAETFFNAEDLTADAQSAISWTSRWAEEYEKLIASAAGVANIVGGTEIDPEFLNQIGLTVDQVKELERVTTLLNGRLDDTGVNSRLLYDDMNALFTSFQNGEINAQQLLQGLVRIETGFNDTYLTVDKLTESLTRLERIRAQMAGTRTAGLLDPNEGTGLPDATAQAARNAAIEENIRLINEQGSAMGDIKAQSNAYVEALHAANQAVIDYVASGEGLLELLYESGKQLSGDQGFLGGVIDLQNSMTALGSAFDILVGGSEALGATSGQLADWAQGLIDAGEAGAALDSLNQIIATNAEVQADVLAIQQAQAPYLAALQADTAAYVDELSRQDAQQQRNVLTLMDANSQQQLAALYSTATAAAMGELGANGTQYVNDMAAALQVTNPLLYDMLVQSGAIKETAEGIEFNFDEVDASALVDTLADLNVAIQDLVSAIDELNGKSISPNIDQAAMDALLAIGEYNKGGPILGDGTGGPYGMAGGGGNVRGGEPQPPKTQTVTITANAEPYFRVSSDVQANAALLAGTETQLLVSANGEQAFTVFRDVEGAVTAVADGEHLVTVTGDSTDASNDIALVNEALNALNGTQGVVYVLGDESDATAAVNNTHAARDGVDGTSGTIYVNGDESGAVGATDAAAGAVYAVDGTSGMIYIGGDASGALNAFNSVNGLVGYATVYIQGVRGTGFSDLAMRDGGVVGYDAAALDGIVTHGGYRNLLVGEAGREVLSVPPGSSVRSAPMTSALLGSGGGGKEVHLHFHNAVYGFDDFQQQVAQGVRSAMYQGQYQ
jgi:hypothetical protein